MTSAHSMRRSPPPTDPPAARGRRPPAPPAAARGGGPRACAPPPPPPRRCPGHARGGGEGAERPRAQAPRARRRVGGPRDLDEPRLQERGRRGGRELGRAQYPFRRARAWDGRGPELTRPAPWRPARLVEAPHFFGFHAAATVHGE